MKQEKFLICGGAGFIGVNFVKRLLADGYGPVTVLDALTYAGNISSLDEEIRSGAVDFVKGDIGNMDVVLPLLERLRPDYVVNFAAETHVDRSVDDPKPFVDTNIAGTQALLDACRRIRKQELADGIAPTLKKFVQISTDEVYGDLSADYEEPVNGLYGPDTFSETSPIRPSSPYSASKAAADMMAMAYYRTFGMPVMVTRCSNNYGPYQFPEKLIPLMINNILEGRPLPVYGQGRNVRDWIHVDDHCRGVLAAALHGQPGQVYNFGGYSERRNIDIVKLLIATVAEFMSADGTFRALADKPEAVNENLITFVADRPGHDRRYAIDASKAAEELGWKPERSFEIGLRDTVEWYLRNRRWVKEIVDGEYRDYYKKMYGR